MGNMVPKMQNRWAGTRGDTTEKAYLLLVVKMEVVGWDREKGREAPL